MSFKKGNLVRLKDGDKSVMLVVEDSDDIIGETTCDPGAGHQEATFETDDLELVAESQTELDKQENPHPMEEQTIAIVSFEGAVKREVKAIREALKLCDTIREFTLSVKASGPVNSGEVEITYEIEGPRYGDGVKGDSVRECLAEFMRRHGWDNIHKPKAISYNGIPS